MSCAYIIHIFTHAHIHISIYYILYRYIVLYRKVHTLWCFGCICALNHTNYLSFLKPISYYRIIWTTCLLVITIVRRLTIVRDVYIPCTFVPIMHYYCYFGSRWSLAPINSSGRTVVTLRA